MPKQPIIINHMTDVIVTPLILLLKNKSYSTSIMNNSNDKCHSDAVYGIPDTK